MNAKHLPGRVEFLGLPLFPIIHPYFTHNYAIAEFAHST
jgi:hypothetical protein